MTPEPTSSDGAPLLLLVLVVALAAVAGLIWYLRQGRGPSASDAGTNPAVDPGAPPDEPPLDDAATLFEPPTAEPPGPDDR